MVYSCFVFFFKAEDGIQDLVRSRGLGDVYKRQQVYRLLSYRPSVDWLLLIDRDVRYVADSLTNEVSVRMH